MARRYPIRGTPHRTVSTCAPSCGGPTTHAGSSWCSLSSRSFSRSELCMASKDEVVLLAGDRDLGERLAKGLASLRLHVEMTAELDENDQRPLLVLWSPQDQPLRALTSVIGKRKVILCMIGMDWHQLPAELRTSTAVAIDRSPQGLSSVALKRLGMLVAASTPWPTARTRRAEILRVIGAAALTYGVIFTSLANISGLPTLSTLMLAGAAACTTAASTIEIIARRYEKRAARYLIA